jgi:mannosyltransferase OCH1-like enzyme
MDRDVGGKIPKVIHYCWFGNNNKSLMIRKCLKTWKKHLSDYKFILWNEKNFKSNNKFYHFALKNKNWAYVSDYVRLQVLYDYGGVYLDTDMFFIKPLSFDFLNRACFFGAENRDLISCGIIGSLPKNGFLKQCLSHYENLEYLEKQAFKEPITKTITKIFREKYNYSKQLNLEIHFENISIFPVNYFYPYPFNINKRLDKNFIKYATKDTVAIHLWNGSWHKYNEFHYIRRRQYLNAIILIFKNGKLNKDYFLKILKNFKKSIKN